MNAVTLVDCSSEPSNVSQYGALYYLKNNQNASPDFFLDYMGYLYDK